jgi:STE24 endopeptidase
MTAMVAIPKIGGVAREQGHYSAWRAAASVPAMFGSMCLLLVLLGFLGRWEPVAMLTWLAFAAAVFTRTGERMAVRVALGLRRPGKRKADALASVWATALGTAGYGEGDVDLYVQRSATVNAYAAGGRSVAVTTGA